MTAHQTLKRIVHLFEQGDKFRRNAIKKMKQGKKLTLQEVFVVGH